MRQAGAFPAQQRPGAAEPAVAGTPATVAPTGGLRDKLRDWFRRPKAGGGEGADDDGMDGQPVQINPESMEALGGADKAGLSRGVLSGKPQSWPAATIQLPEGLTSYDEDPQEARHVETSTVDAEDAPMGVNVQSMARRGGGIASFGSDVTEWDYPIACQAESNRMSTEPATVGDLSSAPAGFDEHGEQGDQSLDPSAAGAYPFNMGMPMGQMPMYCPAPLMMAPPFGGMPTPWGYPPGPMDPAAMGAAGMSQEDLERWGMQQMEGWRSFVESMRQGQPNGKGGEWSARGSASGGAGGGSRSSQRRVGTEAFANVGTTEEGSRTTVMLRNLPNDYTRDMLLKLLDDEGFNGKYDFVYLPVDFKRMAGLGYAFVNMEKHEYAEEIWAHFDGFHKWTISSPKVCQVAWGEPLQGLEAHIERYRNSPVMHPDVEEMFKPVVFKDGTRIAFPTPTKRLRQPRMKYRTPVDARGAPGTDGPEDDGDGALASSKFVD